MSKRHAYTVESILSALTRDLINHFPESTQELLLTQGHLERALVDRGPGVLYVELPALCKHLDRCLDVGLYTRGDEHNPFFGVASPSNLLPVIWGELWAKIFNQETGCLLTDAEGNVDFVAIYFLRQALCLWKKVDLDCPNDARHDTIVSFVRTDRSLPLPPRQWCSDRPFDCDQPEGCSTFERLLEVHGTGTARDNRHLGRTMDAVAAYVCQALGPYRAEEHAYAHGPGAVSRPLSDAGKYQFGNWSTRLDAVFPVSECGFSAFHHWVDCVTASGPTGEPSIGNAEHPSRMVAVRKTYKGPRLIACEPLENQWCQQNVWSYLKTRVKRSWLGNYILFQDQSQNQQLCVAGSKDGSLSTIDLSDASDRVTPLVVEALFWRNPALLQALVATRTRSVELPDDLGVLRLRKFSTMGSACTFPVESLVFLCVALAVQVARICKPGERVTREVIESCRGKTSVFGDDIIVPSDCFQATCQLLESLWFKVNHTKSFSGKHFRESCGVDAVMGEVVTPIYWRKLTVDGSEDVVGLAETHKALVKRGLKHLAELAYATIAEELSPVSTSSTALGVYTPSLTPVLPERPEEPNRIPRDLVSHRYRWNQALQRVEVRVRVVKTTTKRVKTTGHAALLQYFTEKPSPLTKWEAGFTLRSHTRIVWDWVDPYVHFGPELGRCAEIVGLSRCS